MIDDFFNHEDINDFTCENCKKKSQHIKKVIQIILF
jgi:hypothetical protein